VPVGCSIQFQGSYVSAHQDQSPHWNTIGSSNGARATSGEFRMLCKPQRFWLEDVGAASCPAGSLIDDKVTCQNSYDVLHSRFSHPSQRGLVLGHWDGVPTGCSIQYQYGNDMSPHLNTLATSTASRAISGEFRNMCQEPSYWMATTATCPPGTEIDNTFDCKSAYEVLRNEFVQPSKRGLVEGHWNGVPHGCSIQRDGSYVTDKGDASPHFNTYSPSDNSRSQSGEFRPLCMPGRYFLPKVTTTSCPPGTGIATADECEKAYMAFNFKFPARRGLAKGSWGGVPYQCSIQYQHSYVNAHKDQTPHFNSHNGATNRASSGEFVPICKVVFSR